MDIRITALVFLVLCAFALAGKARPGTTTESTRKRAAQLPSPWSFWPDRTKDKHHKPSTEAPPASHGSDWTYEEEREWGAYFPECAGKHQSPININTDKVKKAKLAKIKFRNYDVLPTLQTITNDGHSLKVELTEVAKTPSITGAGENSEDKFNFAQYHFHFGSISSQGSEHTINTVRYPMEMHMVHVNSKYSDVSEAITQPDGLVVLGFLFVVSKNDNPALAPLVDAISEVRDYNSEAYYVQKTNLYALSSLLPKNTKRFYRYMGSLTTPTCNEVVSWTVFQKTLRVSEKQLEVFRTIMNKHGGKTADNFRPTKPLNKRKVYKS